MTHTNDHQHCHKPGNSQHTGHPPLGTTPPSTIHDCTHNILRPLATLLCFQDMIAQQCCKSPQKKAVDRVAKVLKTALSTTSQSPSNTPGAGMLGRDTKIHQKPTQEACQGQHCGDWLCHPHYTRCSMYTQHDCVKWQLTSPNLWSKGLRYPACCSG